MRYIKKFNESFFNIFKNKNKHDKPIFFLDLYDCLYDVLDEPRLVCNLSNYVDGIFHDESEIITKNKKFTFLIKIKEYLSLRIYENEFIFSIMRDRRNISDSEFKEILLDVENKLKIYNCKISFYRSWGLDEGGCDEKEYKSVDSLFKKDVYNLTVKITAPVDINTKGLEPSGPNCFKIK